MFILPWQYLRTAAAMSTILFMMVTWGGLIVLNKREKYFSQNEL